MKSRFIRSGICLLLASFVGCGATAPPAPPPPTPVIPTVAPIVPPPPPVAPVVAAPPEELPADLVAKVEELVRIIQQQKSLITASSDSEALLDQSEAMLKQQARVSALAEEIIAAQSTLTPAQKVLFQVKYLERLGLPQPPPAVPADALPVPEQK